MTSLPADQQTMGWNFDNTYARLPGHLFAEVAPVKVRAPKSSIINHALAAELGLDLNGTSEEALAALFAGQSLPDGAQPIAQAYAGHQFGGFTMLGDGRAVLLGEQRTPSGDLFDIQFKGSGQTPFSRRGDGRAALGPMLREYIISEAMHALRVPTTRGLAVVTTGEQVYRETALPGAILTRVAASHVRVGTFQFLASRKDDAGLRMLADYVATRHFPEIDETGDKYVELFLAVMDRQASLVAKWQSIGFIHGVMNTDNMALSGETIDYGPCAFMDTFDPETVFSSIDHGGRYAYGNQPGIAQWNLARFAETLLPLFDEDQEKSIAKANEALQQFPTMFEQYWLAGVRAKLALEQPREGDAELIEGLFEWMQAASADFTNTFDDLSTKAEPDGETYQDDRFKAWHEQWRARVERDESLAAAQSRMQQANPAVIPRNHRVEEALTSATENSDLSVMHELLSVLTSPFERTAKSRDYRDPPPPGTCYRTFCGT